MAGAAGARGADVVSRTELGAPSGGTPTDPVPRGEVASALEDVLARDEFDQEPSLLQEFLEWLMERITPDADPGRTFDVAAQVFLWLAILMGVLLVLLVVRLWWISRAGRGDADDVDVQAQLRTRVERLRELAREARDQGDLGLALRYLVFCLVLGLGQRGNLTYRDAWTNRELLERGRPSKDVRALLGPLIDELEAKEFGREPTTAADVDRLEELCDRWLAALRPQDRLGAARPGRRARRARQAHQAGGRR